MIFAFPFLALVVAAYNALLVFGTSTLGRVVSQVTLPSGAVWNITTGDTLLIAALGLLFVEMASSGSRLVTKVNHVLSIILLLICIAEFLLVPACGTGVFLLITLMALIDVLAASTVWLKRPIATAGKPKDVAGRPDLAAKNDEPAPT